MTKQELRLELLKLVWPVAVGRENADPDHYIQKAKLLERWCNEDAGHPVEPAHDRRVRKPMK